MGTALLWLAAGYALGAASAAMALAAWAVLRTSSECSRAEEAAMLPPASSGFRGGDPSTVFAVEKNANYTVMSNEHLRNRELSLKAKGLLSQMLSLPEEWDYSLEGLSRINREGVDAIRTGIRELEEHGYLERRRLRDGSGRLAGTEYVVHERAVARPSLPESDEPALGFPMQAPPAQERPALANPRQLSKEKSSKDPSNTYPSKGAGPRARRGLPEYACVAGDVL